MKKLTALLFACMMMTCTFTACGSKDDDDDDDGNKKSTSSSASTEDDDNDEDETEPATKKKKPSTTEDEENTSEDSAFVGKWECIKIVEDGEVFEDEMDGVPIRSAYRIEIDSSGKGYIESESLGDKLNFECKKNSKNKIEVLNENGGTAVFTINGNNMICGEDGMELTFEKVKKFSDIESTSENKGGDKPSGKVDSKIVGKWNTSEAGIKGSYVFKANGNGSIYADCTSLLHFEGDVLMIDDEEFGPDAYDFDGKNFSLEKDGNSFIAMTKKEGSKKSLDGTYDVVGGELYDFLEAQYANAATYSLDMIVDGDETLFCLNDCFTFTADSKTIKITKGAEFMGCEEVDYSIAGNKMTFTANGAKQILTKD